MKTKQLALEALKYHTAQTRPIGRTDAAIAALETDLAAKVEPTCIWTSLSDESMPDAYKSGCGQIWCFLDGGPAENHVRYCHWCGGLVAIKDAS
jgi:hypothetical protein